jgi:exonuclease SbcD
LPSILAAHVSLATAKAGSEQTMMVGREHFLLQSSVADPAFDYVALGHIHRHQVPSYHPPIVYAGSMERLDFSEEEDDKGFYVVDIEGKGKVSFDFHPVEARRFLTIRVHIDSQDPDPTLTILDAIAQRQPEIKDAIVRLQIALPAHAEGSVQDKEIRRALEEAHFIAAIAKEIERHPRIRLDGWSPEALTPLKALEAYLATKTSPERQRTLLKYGERVIQEEAGEQMASTAG